MITDKGFDDRSRDWPKITIEKDTTKAQKENSEQNVFGDEFQVLKGKITSLADKETVEP